MRGSWRVTVMALALCACSGEDVGRAWEGVVAPRQVAPERPDYLGPTPAEVVAVPAAYVACVRKKQAAPEYAVLWGKLFFNGSAAAVAAARSGAANAGPEEDFAIERWELDRKDCLKLIDPYVEYFVHTDPGIVRRYYATQETIRGVHVDLTHGRVAYPPAVARIRAAEQAFWVASSQNHRGMSAVVSKEWLNALPTM